jgi:hypothetical protein
MNLGLRQAVGPEAPSVAQFLCSAAPIEVVFYNGNLLVALF